MNALRRQLEEKRSADPYRKRIDELLRLPAAQRITAIEADLKSHPTEISDRNVFHHKSLVRLWDAARIEAGIVTPMEVQRENSPFTFEELAEAKVTFRPRLRV